MSDFLKRGNHRLNTCEICYKEQENFKYRTRYRDDIEFRDKEKSQSRRIQMRSRYGVELEELDIALSNQQGKCANLACGVEISLTAPKELVKPAVVDHNHVTGKFRALLCNRCNVILGHIEKNPNVIEGLKQYLSQHQKLTHN